jgi:hypothetical protein
MRSKFLTIAAASFFVVLLVTLAFVGKKNFDKKSSQQAGIVVTQNNTQKKSVPLVTGNFLKDADFESTPSGWYSQPTWNTNFKLDSKILKSGKLSALLELDSRQEGSQSTRVYGVSQDLSPITFPNHLSANYYVADWQKTTKNQYIQMVVAVFAPDNIPEEIKGGGNYQIRYVLAGIDNPPTDIKNAKYIIINPEKPVIGQWINVQRDLKKDFSEQWGGAPVSFKSIRVFFEARWDQRTEITPVYGKVYFDDVFMGIL